MSAQLQQPLIVDESGLTGMELLPRGSSQRGRPTVSEMQLARDYIAAQGDVYTAGMVVFLLGSIIVLLGNYVPFFVRLAFIMGGVLQTLGGTVTLATTNLDIPRYLKQRKWRAASFALLWALGTMLLVIVVPLSLAVKVVAAFLINAPFIYLCLHWSEVLNVAPNFPTFVDLFVLSLISFQFWQGIGSFFGTQGTAIEDTAGGWLFVLSSMVLAFVYKWLKRQGKDASTASHIVLLVFLFSNGVSTLMFQVIETRILHYTAEDDPALLPGAAWTYGPMHIVFPCLIFWIRPYVQGWLGRRWLVHRLKYQGTEFSLVGKARGDLAETERAIEAKRNLNEYLQPAASGDDSYTLLHLAAGNGQLESVQKLLEHHVDVDRATYQTEQTPLYLASQNGHLEVVRELVACKGSVDKADVYGFTALYVASLMGHVECVCELISAGGEATEEMLLVAAGNGHRAVVEHLMSAGAVRTTLLQLFTEEDAINVYRQQFHRRDAHGWIFMLGFVLLSVSSAFQVASVLPGINTNEIASSWCSLLFAIFSTSGLVVMTNADIEPNIYFQRNQCLVMIFVVLSVSGSGLEAFFFYNQQSRYWGQILWLPALPWLYLVVRFKQVVTCERKEGFPLFTQLVVVYFALSLFVTAVLALLPPYFGTVNARCSISVGIVFLVGALCTLLMGVYRRTDNASEHFFRGCYCYLFAFGFGYTLNIFLATFVTPDYSLHGESLLAAIPQWLFGPVHMIIPISLFVLEKRVGRHLGKRFLRRRMRQAADEKVPIERGSLAEVEEALAYGSDLETYVLQTPTDGYTLLHLACWNNFHDALQCLLAVGGLNIAHVSQVRGWPALHMAAHNGHADVVRLLIEAAADVNQQTSEGQTALMIAAAADHEDVVATLCLRAAPATKKAGWASQQPTQRQNSQTFPS
jgi:ankyrin repeat protein